MLKILILCFVVIFVYACPRKPQPQQPPRKPEKPKQENLARDIVSSYHKAVNWLLKKQIKSGPNKGGFYTQMPGPKFASVAYTGLVASAIAGAPEEIRKKYEKPLTEMIEFILKMRNPDGSFGENRDFYRIYTTSIAMLAFYRYDRMKYKDIIRDAWYFLRESQVKEGLYEGGFGYGDRKIDKKGRMKERKYADLSNTSFVADAAYEIGIPKTDEFWKKVVIFTTRCQNLSETNRDEILLKTFKQKNYTIANDGGFFYSTNPEKAAKAGCREINGKKVINSYGSMTYTGIKIFIYAGMDKKDPRVQGAFNWIKDRYTVVEHPGFPYDPVKRHHLRGLFYYYRVFSRAFDAIGEKVIKTDRKNIEWAKDLTRVLLKLQKKQGFWQNENPSWQEGDPILSTAYVLDAYNILLKWLKK